MSKLHEEELLLEIRPRLLASGEDALRRLLPILSDLEVIVDHLKHLENYMPDDYDREHGYQMNLIREKEIAGFKFKELYDYLDSEIS